MRIYATVNDRTARRSFWEQKHRKRLLKVLDYSLFGSGCAGVFRQQQPRAAANFVAFVRIV
ncbi:MAG: hypothetical protein OXG59_01440 [Gammaproteobacteria bacterium]|nr:hypothetical protein [Gammaproteobacteria bacterium]